MVHTIEQTLEGKEKGGKQYASIRKSMKRTGQMRQSLRRRTDKADHYFMGHPERGLHLLFAQEKFDEFSKGLRIDPVVEESLNLISDML